MNMHELLQKDPKEWDIFTLKEEYNSPLCDQYGRFPYYASSNRHIFEPLVSKYLINHGLHAEYPEDRPFAVCLTHDIDDVYTSLLPKVISSIRYLKQGPISEIKHSVSQMRSKKLPLWNFDAIIKLEEQYEAKSSFYFMAENPGDQDYAYPIEDCESALADIVDRGSEIGLHGGYSSCSHPEELKSKKERIEKILNKKIIGYRNHYLRFTVPETWRYLHDTGFLYDTTIGYADCVGFRNGMCHPFKPYDLQKREIIDIIEIPLVVMDDSLFDHYMRLDSGRAWDITRRLIDVVSEYHGVITFLWHNYSFTGQKRKFYEKILRYCVEKNAWMTSGEQIFTWWKHNLKD
jgi:peptidoglycan/xylan/chitin deacetylase (PgdA/CDA1 family)